MTVASFKALGTEIFVEIPSEDFEAILNEIKQEAQRIETKFSRFLSDSELSQLNQALNQWHNVDEEWMYLLQEYQNVAALTGPALCLATTDLLEHWGYDAEYNLKREATSTTPKLLELGLKLGAFKSSQALDFGCLGKGYFLDQCRKILAGLEVVDYFINAGGDMTFEGAERSFYLEDPRVNGRHIGVCKLVRGFMCASSASRRQWGPFHHLIEPQTQQPAHEMLAVFVQSNTTGLITDALSTAFFVLGFERSQKKYELIKVQYPSLEILLISAQGKVWRSNHFIADLYTT